MKQITPEIICSFFQCKRKSFLISNSSKVKYKKTDYELMLEQYAFDVKKDFLLRSTAQCYYKGIFEKGVEFIKDINIQILDYQFYCDLLKKEIGKSAFGNFYYEPVVFIGNNKVTKQDRIELAALGLILEKIQGKLPTNGIAFKKDGTQQRLKIESLYPEIESCIIEIKEFKDTEPAISLNKNCNTCTFENDCKEKAVSEDNLSLIEKITPKQIKQFEQKGIFSVKQLSHLYRPRRKKTTSKTIYSFKPELQALAIRTKKTYIKELPILNKKEFFYILDIESIPDDNFFYLFGIMKIKNGEFQYFPFWSNIKEEELFSCKKVIDLLNENSDAPIYHYGNYELNVFKKLSKKYNLNVKSITERFVNINTFIYGKIYFPTYSNRLKELAEILGFKWRNSKASGIRSIVWRFYWEQGKKEYKEILFAYNKDDCEALKVLIDELERIQNEAEALDHINFIDKVKDNSTEVGKDLHKYFDIALELAHHEYDRKKIKVNFEKKKVIKSSTVQKRDSKHRWLNKDLKKPDKTIVFPPDKYCFKHKTRRLNKSRLKYKRLKFDLVFSRNGIRKTIIEYIGQQAYCPLCNNSYASVKFREITRDLYGHSLKAWVVFQRVEIQLSFSKISSSLYGIINEKLRPASGVAFVQQFSEYYEETENKIIEKLLESFFIHADETTVNILGETQYVWVLSSDKFVLLKLTKHRDISIVKELLNGYSGVLISDFFAGYDSVDCIQQKCWVHLMRDLNNDLWKNPFDKEYEDFVVAVRDVIIPILESSYKFGLKKHHFSKHKKPIEKFYKNTIDRIVFKSELCKTYQKRFKRYRDSLFTFIDFDGINWHNNIAENRIRHICVQRKISGTFGPNQFPHYLRMLSIMQSCKLQNKSFLGFLLSQEKDLENFKNGKRSFELNN
jgi:predicted RecB family nuclease